MEALSKLGIDWRGIILYLVNFGLLFFVLGRLLYKPLLKFLDERRDTIKRNLDESEELRKTLASELSLRDQELKQSLKLMREEIEQTKTLAEARAAELVAQAEKERAVMLDEARATIDAMKGKLHQEVAAEVMVRVEKIIHLILKEKVPREAIHTSVAEAWPSAVEKATK